MAEEETAALVTAVYNFIEALRRNGLRLRAQVAPMYMKRERLIEFATDLLTIHALLEISCIESARALKKELKALQEKPIASR